jgi:hypothetical protein
MERKMKAIEKAVRRAACQRADGTLRTFNDRQVSWRVDLNADTDLTASGRAAIRTAMYEGTPHCKE